MSLPLQTYESFYRTSEQYLQQRGFLPLDPGVSGVSGVSYDVAGSVHGIAMHKHLMRCLPRLQVGDSLHRRMGRWLQGESALSIAGDPGLNLPPMAVMRNLLVGLLCDTTPGNVGKLIDSPQGILGRVFRPEVLGGVPLPPQAHRALLHRLQGEVRAGIEADPQDSPLLRDLRTWSGEEYEWRLEATLASIGVPPSAYLTQDDLIKHWRSRGEGIGGPTPDILFRWPLVMPCPHGGPPQCSGCTSTSTSSTSVPPFTHLVSWIDSKASFAYPSALHTDDSKYQVGRQVSKYGGVFGPGLVVFWGGYVDSVPSTCPVGVGVSHRPPGGGGWRWATVEEKGAWIPTNENSAALFLHAPPHYQHHQGQHQQGSPPQGKRRVVMRGVERGRVWEDLLVKESGGGGSWSGRL